MVSHFEQFLAMGGYAKYVWSAYGLGVIVIIGNGIYTARIKRDAIAKLKRRYRT